MRLWGRNKPEPVNLNELLAEANPGRIPKRRAGQRRIDLWLASVAVAALGVGMIVAPAAVGLSVAGNSVLDMWEELPTDLPVDRPLPQHTVLLDKDGKEFARIYSENRTDVKLDQVSEAFKETLIATEDARFYEHRGVDPLGVTRALINNVTSENVQGASTITQQLVQNMLVNHARDEVEEQVAVGVTYNAKIREAKYALALEKQLTKLRDEATPRTKAVLEARANFVDAEADFFVSEGERASAGREIVQVRTEIPAGSRCAA